MLKRRRTLLCVVHGEGASVTVQVCHDRRAFHSLVSRYGRLNFATQCVDFCAPYEIDRNYVETAPHGDVLYTRGNCERDGCSVL